MRRFALLLACLVAAARADTLLFVVDTGGEHAVGAALNVGQAAVGDVLTTQFRVRNTGTAAVNIRVLSVSGTAFTLVDPPSVPRSLGPGQALDFAVSFRPEALGSYSAVLQVEGVTAILNGTTVAAVTVFVDGNRLASGAAIEFGTTERGASVSRTVTLVNQTPNPLLVPAISVNGDAFRVAGTPPSGQRLDPTASVTFGTTFQPLAAGAQQGTLRVGERSFTLNGMGVEPPLPGMTLRVELAAPLSGQQGKVFVDFDAPARTSGSGTLTLEFQPLPVGASDPAIVLAPGSREAAFTVTEGATGAVFGAQPSVAFQTGSTAGTLSFTARLGTVTRQATVVFPPAPIAINSFVAARNGTGVDLVLTGLDNTRTAGALTFSFFDKAGAAVAPGAIRTDNSADFQKYFATSTLGGVFLLKATFPVTGTAGDIDSVEVELANSAGTVKTPRTKIP